MGPSRSTHSSYRYAPWNTGAPCHIESTDQLSILCGLLGNEEANQPPLESPDTRALVHQRSTQYKFLPDPSITIQPSEALVRQPSLPRDVQELNDSLRLGTRVIEFVHKMMFEVPHVHEVADILRRLTCKSNHASTSRETTRDPELDTIFHLSSLLHEFDQEMYGERISLAAKSPTHVTTIQARGFHLSTCDERGLTYDSSAQREHKEDPGQSALGGEDLLQIAVLREEVHNGESGVEDTRKGLESTSMMAGNLASYTMVGGVGDMDVAGENSLLGCEFESYR
ncbi:unnamed protein product [Rhizoctonia solani]|nr:unnamed protein product [Rhizoctonia solani]